jgi:hypothetical protein
MMRLFNRNTIGAALLALLLLQNVLGGEEPAAKESAKGKVKPIHTLLVAALLTVPGRLQAETPMDPEQIMAEAVKAYDEGVEAAACVGRTLDGISVDASCPIPTASSGSTNNLRIPRRGTRFSSGARESRRWTGGAAGKL